jgi:hypothetical protein
MGAAETISSTRRWSGIKRFIRDLIYVLKISRFSFWMLLAGVAMLMLDQGQDVLVKLGEESAVSGHWFYLAVTWWAVNTWYWARIMLDFRFPDEPDNPPVMIVLRDHIPRIMGTATFVFTAIAMWKAGAANDAVAKELSRLAWWGIFYGVLFYVFLRFRKPILYKLMASLERQRNPFARIILSVISLPEVGARYRTISNLPINTRIFLGFTVLTGLVAFFLGWFTPLTLGKLGAAVLFFLWTGTWIPVGSTVVYFANQTRTPVLILLLVLAVLFSPINDNHEIRHAKDSLNVSLRPTVDDAARAWRNAHLPGETKKQPFIIVATAGGGIRASYWTATVLGAIQDARPQFGDHLFAVSGVSGGSVGAAVFRAVLQAQDLKRTQALCDLGQTPQGWQNLEKNPVTSCSQAVLGRDFLGPTVARMFYPDLVQRFLPLPQSVSLPDRSEGLELAWEDSWEKTMQGAANYMAGSLLSLYASQNEHGAGSWPALFLNGTWVQTGRRIVASNLNLVKRDPSVRTEEDKKTCRGIVRRRDDGSEACFENSAFIVTHDLLYELGRDLPLSSAAANSARFPYVSPAGTMRKLDTKRIFGRVVDGGYFENYGAQTAMEILEEAVAAMQTTNHGIDDIQFVVIQISSDPSLPDPVDQFEENPLKWAPEIRSPLRTFMATRGARGMVAVNALREKSEALKGRFYHLRMCPQGDVKASQPPLGWALSHVAQETIQNYLDPKAEDNCRKHNRKAMDEIIQTIPR